MTANISHLSRIFTPTYAARINAQLVYPASSQIVKPNELLSALARPLQVAHYRPEKPPSHPLLPLPMELLWDIRSWTGTSEQSGIFRPMVTHNVNLVAFFLSNEYMKIMGFPGLSHGAEVDAEEVAEQQNRVATGELGVEGLALGIKSRE